MNRYDEIMAKALDAAVSAGVPVEKRNRFADDLIDLVGLMMQGLGKYVESDGEADMNNPEDFREEVGAFTRFQTGSRMQRAADKLRAGAKAADLSRYEDSKWGHPVWRPRCGDCGVRVGLFEDVQYPVGGERIVTLVEHAEGCVQRCRECKRVGNEHKMDCSVGRAVAAPDNRARCVGCGQPGCRSACQMAEQQDVPDCTGCTDPDCQASPHCVGCGGPADHGTSCIW